MGAHAHTEHILFFIYSAVVHVSQGKVIHPVKDVSPWSCQGVPTHVFKLISRITMNAYRGGSSFTPLKVCPPRLTGKCLLTRLLKQPQRGTQN